MDAPLHTADSADEREVSHWHSIPMHDNLTRKLTDMLLFLYSAFITPDNALLCYFFHSFFPFVSFPRSVLFVNHPDISALVDWA